ncbi:MAG TPA: hypothetical protein VII75_01145 [Thermoanaerobaculia bacterium]|nr:hypothetical protein [Thermoanaerobaculia bacterium]
MTALAKRLHRCIAEYNDTHDDRLPITPAMSRILEHDPSYVPYRPRRVNRVRRGLERVALQSIVEIADHVGVSVAYLIGEEEALSTIDRQKLNVIGRFLTCRFPVPESGRWSRTTSVRVDVAVEED